ncbi:hypothetical protein ABK040_005870 [Willaertia magna]
MSNFLLYGYHFRPLEFKLKGLSLEKTEEFLPLECLNFKYTKIYTYEQKYVVFKTQNNELFNLPISCVQAIIDFCKKENIKLENLKLETKNLLFKNLKNQEIYTLEECTILNLEKTFVKIGWLSNCNVDIYFDYNTILILDLQNKLNIIQINIKTKEIKKINFNNEKIKTILTGALGRNFCVILENNKIYTGNFFQTEELTFCGKQIIDGSRNGNGFCIVTKENNVGCIYGNGIPTLGGFGPNFVHTTTFIKVDCPLLLEKNSSPIISVKAGYYHHIFLLENGKVIGVGYNVLNQTNGEVFGTSNICDFTFSLLDRYIPNLGKIKRIGGSSRGSYYWNEKNEIYFIGEVAENLENVMIIEGKKRKVYKMELNLLREKYGGVCKEYFPNEVVGGGWHYFVAYDKEVDEKDSKDSKFFFTKLREMSSGNESNLFDINFN